MKRPISAAKVNVIQLVARNLAPSRRLQLMQDLAQAMAIPVTPDGSRVEFVIDGYRRPPYRGQHSFGVSGVLSDRDGAKLSFDLFGDENDRLLELELVRVDGDALIEPNWSTLELY